MEILLGCVVLFIFISIFVFLCSGEDILKEYSISIFLKSFIFFIFEIFIIYLVYYLGNYSFLDTSTITLSIIEIFFLLFLILFNVGLIKILNVKLDSNETQIYFVKLLKKDYHGEAMSGSSYKGPTESIHYFFEISSWLSKHNKIRFETDETMYKNFNEGDIFKIKTKKGFFNFNYFVTRFEFEKVESKIFPENTIFPLTEREALKLLNNH